MKPSDMAALEGKVKRLEKDVSDLKDALNVHENWNSEIKHMFGKRVLVLSRSGNTYCGELLWSDRYCLCVDDEMKKRRLTLTKGGIESVSLA